MTDFDALYTQDPDPWRVATSWYERRKLAVLLAALPRESYATGWETGCGPGITTTALLDRVEHLTASDASEVAVGLARRRCGDRADLHVSSLPASPLAEPVELVVAAELLYYVADLPAALATLWSACRPSGHLAFVHWAHHPHDTRLSGAQVHARVADLASARGAHRLVTHAEPDFLLDVYEVAA